MKPILPLPVRWSSQVAGGAKSGWLLLAIIMAASSPSLIVAADMPISAVQETLKREQFFYGETNGVFDEPTRAALRRFQIRYGLPVSGEIDQATLQALQNPREKDAVDAPAPVADAKPKAGRASPTTNEKDREFLQDLQQSGTAPSSSSPPVTQQGLPPSAPAAAAPAPQATGEATARIVNPRTTVEDDAARPGAPTSEPTRRVVTRTTTTIVSGDAETDDDPDPLGPHGVRIIRPPGTVPAPAPTVPEEQRTRIVEERRTTTVSPTSPPPARAPASTSGLPIYPQADEPPSRVLPEAPPRKPQGFLQRLFRGDR